MKRTLVALVILLWAVQSPAKVKFPDYVGFVNDFAKTLGDTSQLEHRLEAYDRETGNQVVVVTVPTADPLTPQQYAEELFDAWKPGQKGKDNGIIILNAVNERRVVIRSGYGLEADLPDAKIGRILDTSVIPHFKEGNPLLGLYSGAEAVIAVITPGKEKPVPEIVPSPPADTSVDTTPCKDIPNLPERVSSTRFIQDFEKGSSDDVQIQKLRDDYKMELVVVGVDAIPKGISGHRFAECLVQNWKLGASLKREGKGMAIVADKAAGLVYVGLGSRLKENVHASTFESLIQKKSDELSKPLAISESLPIIVIVMGNYAGDDWEDLTWIATIGIVGLGLIYLMGYLIYMFFRALFAVCPKCYRRFPKLLKRKIVRAPTSYYEGIENRSYRCRQCGNEWVKTVTLAKRWATGSSSRSSGGGSSGGSSGSSGSSSFGGGSSGGGGADRGY